MVTSPSLIAPVISRCELSVVVPVYNEYESIPLLVDKITGVAQLMDVPYELICVDDGSTDGSAELLKTLAKERHDLRVILLRRNYGQTPAMAAGFNYARGRVIVTLDGDLQNEPADIATVYQKLNEGYDLVSGWRKNRQDNAVTRLLPSKIANWLIAGVTGVRLHDYGCSLKAYSADVVKDMNLYGELHRFLPALAYIEGARISEVPVRHHARQFGQSKYGLGRTFRVALDLMTIYFMKTFLTRPMHVFGPFGALSVVTGLGLSLYLAFVKFILQAEIGDRPLLLLAVVLFISGIQLLSVGLLAELMMRTYHESQQRPIYRVREVVGGKVP
ncbi:glycosyltransferase family 2 protein [Leptothoe sp. PORK10 BA2]|uniref:glycosyltransferase family 2 protein n=1 Tax=Leptothoe sp. PORK10 BA2 TaxID=3110254 RepID=UPI002B1F27C6|nr:glycosyltransferase family 2 protein [Leptothoe sp. PORK10 BA2]MEA5463225.1 glycosyltransferase family 2 protein [Leptothoe sp. PORK10 BA2]